MPTHVVSPATLHLHDFGTILSKAGRLSLSAEAIQRINKCRAYLDQKIASTSTPLYGINTGFGSLYNKHISKDDLERLQDNLVKSHACGTGPEVPPEIVRLMLFLKVQSLSYGYSGVQEITVQRLLDFYNHDITPKVYEMGSLGASGDLAPLAHMAAGLIGVGDVMAGGRIIPAAAALKAAGLSPCRCKPV